MKIPVIKGSQFILRPFQKGDEKSLQKNVNNKKIHRMTSHLPHPYFLKDAKKWIKLSLAEYKKKDPQRVAFVIDIDKNVVGSIEFHNIRKNHKAEIGYWLAESCWGKGIMTEALKLMTEFGFGKLNLKRIQLRAYVFNKASQKVAKNADYKFEGVLKKDVKKENKFLDSYMFAKVK